MLSLKANLFPFRFKRTNKGAVELTVVVARENPVERYLSLKLACAGQSFSFSREKFILDQKIDFGKVSSFSKTFVFPLYAISQTLVREPLLITLREHEGDEAYPLQTVKKELELILD